MAVRSEHLINNFRNGQVLKNFAIAASAGKPKPRPKFGGVDNVCALAAGIAKPRADAIERTNASALFGFNFKGDAFAEHGFGAERGGLLAGVQHDVVFERNRQRLGTGHLPKPKRFTERGHYVNEAFCARHLIIPLGRVNLSHR